MIRRLVALALIVVGAVAGRPAWAADGLSGVVLMTPSATSVIVHHGAFAGMPAMTMTFTLPPATHVHPGDRITADVDRTTDPWTLSHVHIAGSELPAAHAAPAPFLKAGDRVPATTFVDQTGRRFTLDALRGAPYALTFIYTRCVDPAMCPLVSAKFRSIERRAGRPFPLVEVSLDPAYDRPAVLARYAATFAADAAHWHLLTGDPRRVLDFGGRFGILERSAGPVTIVHSERLAIVGGDGRIRRFFDGAAWAPDEIVRALEGA